MYIPVCLVSSACCCVYCWLFSINRWYTIPTMMLTVWRNWNIVWKVIWSTILIHMKHLSRSEDKIMAQQHLAGGLPDWYILCQVPKFNDYSSQRSMIDLCIINYYQSMRRLNWVCVVLRRNHWPRRKEQKKEKSVKRNEQRSELSPCGHSAHRREKPAAFAAGATWTRWIVDKIMD